MKLSYILLGLLGFSIQQGVCLDKTEQQAQKFLVDEGHVSADAVVESFAVDRKGHVRIGLLENGMRLSYGLEEDSDTYTVAYMSKRKDKRKKKKTEEEAHQELTTLLSENFCFLEGGKVTSMVKEAKTKNVILEYEIADKTYQIDTYYNQRKSQIGVKSILEMVPEEQAL